MYSKQNSLIDLLAVAAGKFPDRTALKDKTRSVTYLELWRSASDVSILLKKKGVRTGDRIVCITKKNAGSLICFWGILLSGGIPVLLEHDDGEQTNNVKINVVAPRMVILDRNSMRQSEGMPPFIEVDIAELNTSGELSTYVQHDMSIDVPDTCYILLTSGTSGTPKAVQVSHTNIIHYTDAICRRIDAADMVHSAHVTTFAADLGLTNLLVSLATGGMLRILDKEEATDPETFLRILSEDSISLLKMTPSHLLSVLAGRNEVFPEPVDKLILGGEKLSWATAKLIYELKFCRTLYNHYGPTETTIGATAFKVDMSFPYIDDTASVPIGYPLGRGSCFLDKEEIGELYIAGPGVSQGYFRNPAEMEKRFCTYEQDGRELPCYRTGDICRKLDDGCFEFLYRTDRQVKLRGYRIELGEIEVLLSSHPDIENAIVAMAGGREHPYLEAYIRLPENKNPGKEGVRKWMLDMVPAYKVPAEFYFYDTPVFNVNGKIDLAALKNSIKAAGVREEGQKDEKEPETWASCVEMAWKKALNRLNIAMTDNFFEAGGDSLLAIQCIGRLQRYGFKVHIGDLNNNPFYGDFLLLAPERASREPLLTRVENSYTYPQRAFLQQAEFPLDPYCQSILLEAGSRIHIREMAMAIDCVFRNHVQLGRAFPTERGRAAHSFYEKHDAELGTSILNGNESSITQIQQMGERILKEMSIEKGRLFRAHIFIDPQGADYLFIICHHLVIDVISWHILIDEIADYYDRAMSRSLPDLNPENDVNLFCSRLAKTGLLPGTSKTEERTIEIFGKKNQSHAVFGSQVLTLLLPESICSALLKVNELRSPYLLSSYLLCALAKAFFSEYGLDEISIDVEFHGRPRHDDLPDISRSVAWWSTTLPINFKSDGFGVDKCASIMKKRAKDACALNMMNPAMTQRRQRADVRFNYLGHFPGKFGNDRIQLTPSVLNPGLTRSMEAQTEYKLFFTSRFIGEKIVIDIQYQQTQIDRHIIHDIGKKFFSDLKCELDKDGYDCGNGKMHCLESNLPSVGLPLYSLGNRDFWPAGNRKRYVLLTGVTGFLGIYILRELLMKDDVFVVCIVRGDTQSAGAERLEKTYRHYFDEWPRGAGERVRVVRGDLSSDRMGLDEKEYRNLSEGIDLIIHAAADINLFRDYSDLVKNNVAATVNIVELAKTGRQKEVSYISSLAISGYSVGEITRTFSEDDYNYGQLFISDYERTKFEAEGVIRDFIDQGGTGNVFRSGHIAADSIRGKFQYNSGQNRIFQIIKGILLLKKMPAQYNETVSFSYVDIVAKGVVDISLGMLDTTRWCFHLENPQYLSFIHIARILKDLGHQIEMVEMEAFKEAAANFEGAQHDREIVDMMSMWIQRFLDFPRNTSYMQRETLTLLAQLGGYFPRVDSDWFKKMIGEDLRSDLMLSISAMDESTV